MLTREAIWVAIGGKMTKGLGPLGHIAGTRLLALGRSEKVVNFIAKTTTEQLDGIRELIEAGSVKPVIDRRYPLSEVAEAVRYLGTHHARAKVVITV